MPGRAGASKRETMKRFATSLPRRRFVAVIGDEGCSLALVSGREVKRRTFLSNAEGENVDILGDMLAVDPHIPVYLLLDVVEQQYREIEVPTVSYFDKAKVTKRKLALTYAEDYLTGLVPQVIAKKGQKRHYLAAGVPMTPELKKWLELFVLFDNPVDAICLLPIEAVPLIPMLRTQRPAADVGKSWQLLFTHQRASGFRQIIAQDNRLVFTRITPQPPAGSDAQTIADIVEREFQSTIGYLRRLSFTDTDRVEMVVVTQPDVCDALNAKRLRVRSLTALSPDQVANRLGLREIADPDDGYADILHAACFAQKLRPGVSVSPPAVRRAALLARTPRVAVAAGIGALLLGAAAAAETVLDLVDANNDRSEITAQAEVQQVALNALTSNQAEMPVRPDIVDAVITATGHLNTVTPQVDTLIRRVSDALPMGTQVIALSARAKDSDKSFGSRVESLLAGESSRSRRARRGADEEQGPRHTVLRLSIQLPGPFDSRDQIARRFRAVVDSLNAALPDHDITVTRDPLVGSGEGFQGVVGMAVDPAQNRLPTFVTSELLIAGDA